MAKDKSNPLIFILLGLILLSTVLYYLQSTQSQLNLSELQIAACNAADAANTCDSRLAEIGIVLKEECCQALGKCCS